MTHGLSPIGQGAFEDLARCVRSQDSTNLNIFFLVDSSASLKVNDTGGPGSDPSDKRALVLSQTIRQLSSLNDKIAVNFALDTFDETSPGTGDNGKAYSGLDWKNATESKVSSASAWVEKNLPNYDGGQHTNWLAGLQNAQNQLANAPHGSGTSCQAIIWFTDGALDMAGGKNQNAEAILKMCGVQPTTTGSGLQKGLIPNLRANNITLIGVLLSSNNAEAGSTGLVTYFKPIIEGGGEVDSTSFGGSSRQNFECGLNPAPANYSRGAMLVAKNPNDLALLFASIPFMVGKGQEVKLTKDNEFSVDKGVASAAIVIPSKKWKLVGPEVSIESSSPDKNYKIHTVGDVSTVEFNIPANGQGNYQVIHDGSSPIAVFLDSGVRIQIDRNVELEAGKGLQKISGIFINLNNKPIDIGIYDNPVMTVASVDTSGQNRTAKSTDLTINQDGKWSGQVLPFDGSSSAQLQFSVTLRTKPSGTELPTVSQTFNLPLLVPAQFCNVVQIANGKNQTAKFSNLVYKKSPASGSIIVEGAKDGNCSVKFGSPTILSDPVSRPSKDFQISIDAPGTKSDSVLNSWVQVPQGQKIKFTLAINSRGKANGETLMSIPVLIRDQAATQNIQSAAKIAFTNQIPEKNKLIWLLLILILGLTLPLVLLQIVNHLFSRYRMENLRIASMRVRVIADSTESRVTLLDGSPIYLQDQMFEYFETSLKRPRSFSAEYKLKPMANFQSHLPRNPFGSVEGVAVAKPDEVIVVSESARTINFGAQAPVPLNLNRVFFATAERKKTSAPDLPLSNDSKPSLLDDDFGIGLNSPTPTDDIMVEINPDSSKASFEAQLSVFLNYEPLEAAKIFNSVLEAISASPMWTNLARLREGKNETQVTPQKVKPQKQKISKAEKSSRKSTGGTKEAVRTSDTDLWSTFDTNSSGGTTSGSSNSGSPSSDLPHDPDDPWA